METKTIRYELLLKPSVSEKLADMARRDEASKAAVIERLILEASKGRKNEG